MNKLSIVILNSYTLYLLINATGAIQTDRGPSFCTQFAPNFQSRKSSVSTTIFHWGVLYLLVGKVGGTKNEMEVKEF